MWRRRHCGSMPGSRSQRTKPTSKSGGAKPHPSDDWQDELESEFRRLIEDADPTAVEKQQWKKPSNPAGVPVWHHDGIICLVNQLKGRVRLTFPYGASLPDPKGLFNACLEAGSMRGIDVHEGEAIDGPGVKALVRAAVAKNRAMARERR
jgi:hypothetical protein